ncbi:hypothetical protein ACIQGT_14135 [Streptomyces sp. NPDC093108]|uniref:hypothetical protein n=1 Tax=unclassified Streptomyces TaxID=2593676 RepID=UPI003814C338
MATNPILPRMRLSVLGGDPSATPLRRIPTGAVSLHHLSTVGTHFTTHRPDDQMTEAARMTVALRTARAASVARPLLGRLPFPTGGITRGEYGQRVLAQIGGPR